MQNNLFFPLENLLKNDLKEKNELKKSLEKSLKDYDAKFTKLEKDRKAAAKESGWIRTDITHHEFAEELEGERKTLQLELCKFFLKINKINSKKGVDLLQHLVDYYHTQAK